MYKDSRSSIVLSLWLVFFLALPVCAGAHQDIWLRNEQGDRISPTLNSADPYSPRRTCGACHSYQTITSGYHFQQGFDEMKDRYDNRRPWLLSPGMFGKWLPTAAAGFLAPKVNAEKRRMDLSTYDWIGGYGKYDSRGRPLSMSCGWCHPGGGPMEYGRDGQGRADKMRTLMQAEADSSKTLDGDYSSLMTPDGKSRFRQSGVVEADCLICHKADYAMPKRNEQLNRRNYRWAATSGAGLGTVTGAVFSYAHPDAGPDDPRFVEGAWNLSKRPVVAYAWSDRRNFLADGRLRGQVIRKTVGAKNCLQCHGEAHAKNTGALHTPDHDAHVRAGMMCIDCHPLTGSKSAERLRHQIAKGHSPVGTVRDDLDGLGVKTCAGCHGGGQYRPTRPGMPKEARNPLSVHLKRLPKAAFHTYLVDCNGCHATAQPARALLLLDMSVGLETGYTADHLEGVRWPSDYAKAAKAPWPPWMVRGDRYTAAVPKWMQMFGERLSNGEIHPIPLRHVRQAARGVKGLTVIDAAMPDGGRLKRQTVASDRDIKGMLERLQQSGFSDAVFLADRVYRLEKGAMVAEPRPGQDLHYTVEHSVVPLSRGAAYGTKGRPLGCKDCHQGTSPFFAKMVLKDIRGFLQKDYPQLKAPHAVPQWRLWKLRGAPMYE